MAKIIWKNEHDRLFIFNFTHIVTLTFMDAGSSISLLGLFCEEAINTLCKPTMENPVDVLDQ